MAQGFARLYRRFWSDERVRQLEPEEKLVAAYLLTAQSNRIGLFRFSVGMAEDDLGIPRKRLETVLGTVCHTLGWGWDTGSNVVLLRSWWKWNPPDNNDALIGYLKDLADIPKTALLADFRVVSDTLPPTLRDTVLATVVIPEPLPSPSPNLIPKPIPSRVKHLSADADALAHFPEFYDAYPRKENRPDAEKAWRQVKAEACLESIADGLKRWKLRWNDPQFIPMPATWLRGKRWMDQLNGNGSKPDRGRQIMEAAMRMKAEEEARNVSS